MSDGGVSGDGGLFNGEYSNLLLGIVSLLSKELKKRCCGAVGHQKEKMCVFGVAFLGKYHATKLHFYPKNDFYSASRHYLFVPFSNDAVWMSNFLPFEVMALH